MSLLFGERRSLASWLSDSSPSTRTVTPESATYLAPVFASFRHIFDYISTLPVVPYRVDEQGKRQRMSSLPSLLASCERGLGPAHTGYGVGQWLGQAALGMAQSGNAVGWVDETDNYGSLKPTDVRWLRRVDWDYHEDARQWYVAGRKVPAEKIVHIPWITLPGYVLGLSPMEHFASMVAAGLSAQEYADVRRGGGIPPAILKNNTQTLSATESEAIQARAVTSFASGKPFVSGKDWDLSIVTIPPAQAQFIQTLQLTANHTAAIYGLDPRDIGGSATESLTYATDESRALNRANNMRPYIERLEQAIARLLPERQFINLDTDATIRTDIKTRTDVMQVELDKGVASVNEWRDRLDKPPIPGGDFYNIPAPKTDPTTRETP